MQQSGRPDTDPKDPWSAGALTDSRPPGALAAKRTEEPGHNRFDRIEHRQRVPGPAQAVSPPVSDLASDEDPGETQQFGRGFHEHFEDPRAMRPSFGLDHYSSHALVHDPGLIGPDFPAMLSGIEPKRQDAFLAKRQQRYTDPLDFRGAKELRQPHFIAEEEPRISERYQASYLPFGEEQDRRPGFAPRFAELPVPEFCGSPPLQVWATGQRAPIAEAPRVASKPPVIKEGDWTCASCGNVNWARRTACNL